MSVSILEKITQEITKDPRSGQSLLLFALVATLNVEKTGHMYMLAKLKEFTPSSTIENQTGVKMGLLPMNGFFLHEKIMTGKLKEFTPENRKLAYEVIELMASNESSSDVWQEAYSKMEIAIRG